MQRPDHPIVDDIEGAVADFMIAEQRVADAKERLRRAALALKEVEDEVQRLRIATFLYWALPDVSTHMLAQAVTGQPGKRGVYALLRQLPPKVTDVVCARCGGAVRVRTREELKRLGSVKSVGSCEHCAPPRPAMDAIEFSITNSRPSARFRTKIEQRIAERGAMLINVKYCFGGKDIAMGPALLELYLQDPDAAAARALGVSKEDYVGYLTSWCSVQCSGTTKHGTRCSNTAVDLKHLELEDWIEAERVGGYCKVHGG